MNKVEWFRKTPVGFEVINLKEAIRRDPVEQISIVIEVNVDSSDLLHTNEAG